VGKQVMHDYGIWIARYTYRNGSIKLIPTELSPADISEHVAEYMRKMENKGYTPKIDGKHVDTHGRYVTELLEEKLEHELTHFNVFINCDPAESLYLVFSKLGFNIISDGTSKCVRPENGEIFIKYDLKRFGEERKPTSEEVRFLNSLSGYNKTL
jgi:hypothetical protein